MRRGRKAAVAVLACLIVLLAINTVMVNGETRQAEITTPRARLVETSVGDVQVAVSGQRQASPLVLLHCYTCSMHWWEAILPLLEKRHRVIRVDLLGHGGSEKSDGDYSMKTQAHAVASALEQIGVEQATIVGHSLGFSVGTAVAELRPRLVSGLANIDEWSHTDQGELPLTARLGYVPVLGQALSRITPDFAIRDGLKIAFAPDYDLADGFEDPDQVVEDFRQLTYTAYTKIDDGARAYLDEAPAYERLTNLGLPVLVIFGSEDQLYDSPRQVADTYRRVPGARVVMIDGAGHSANVEKPAKTAALILDFARRSKS